MSLSSEMAVVLPIVCVAVIVFFVVMAVIAHVRYPHVSYHGQKRHRQKPWASSCCTMS